MPPYAAQIAREDRWKAVLRVRELQETFSGLRLPFSAASSPAHAERSRHRHRTKQGPEQSGERPRRKENGERRTGNGERRTPYESRKSDRLARGRRPLAPSVRHASERSSFWSARPWTRRRSARISCWPVGRARDRSRRALLHRGPCRRGRGWTRGLGRIPVALASLVRSARPSCCSPSSPPARRSTRGCARRSERRGRRAPVAHPVLRDRPRDALGRGVDRVRARVPSRRRQGPLRRLPGGVRLRRSGSRASDWIMSLEPHWYSTMFGVYHFAGIFLSRAGHHHDPRLAPGRAWRPSRLLRARTFTTSASSCSRSARSGCTSGFCQSDAHLVRRRPGGSLDIHSTARLRGGRRRRCLCCRSCSNWVIPFFALLSTHPGRNAGSSSG